MPDLTPTSRKIIQRTFLSKKLSFPLDNSSEATTALGLRRLNREHEGAILRIRLNTTDYPEFDIGFDAKGDLDTRRIQSLLDSYSATEAWVPIAYDQGGNGLDATQATASRQPLIVSGGEILDFVDFSNLTVALSAGNYQVFVPQKYGLEKTDTYTQLNTSDFSWRQSLNALIIFSLDKTLEKQKITLDLTKEIRFAPEQINWDSYNGLMDYRDSFRNKNLYFVPSDLDTSNGTGFRSCWRNNNLTSFPAINLSNGTDFFATWYADNLTSFPAIDLSNGTDFQLAWFNNELTSFPAIDLSNGTDFNSSWRNNNLTSFPAIDLSNGTNFHYCWRDNNLTSFPAIDLSNGTDFQDSWKDNDLDKKSAENIIASLFVNHETNSHALSTTIGTDGTFTSTDLDDNRIRSVAQDPPLNYSGSFPSGTTIYDYLTSEGWTIDLS
jgi:hypothetical protein